MWKRSGGERYGEAVCTGREGAISKEDEKSKSLWRGVGDDGGGVKSEGRGKRVDRGGKTNGVGFFFLMIRRLPRSTLFPDTTLFRSGASHQPHPSFSSEPSSIHHHHLYHRHHRRRVRALFFRAVVPNWRPAGRIRPAEPSNPACEGILGIRGAFLFKRSEEHTSEPQSP